MRRTISLFLIIVALLSSSVAVAQATDTDGDGLPDSSDRCPNEAGPRELQGCPDTDGDTVPDIDDGCPTVAGVVENRGCPPDSDGDGTPDSTDQCPTQGGHADNGGCPQAPSATEVPAEPTAAPQPERNLIVPPADGDCLAAPILNMRVNGRAEPAAEGAIIAVLEPNVLYPVMGVIVMPDEQPFYYLKYKLEDVIVSSAVPTDPDAAFESGFLGGVFVGASALNVGGDCTILVGLLLPAVQKVREAAARMNQDEEETGVVLHVRKSGADGTYMTIKLSDVLVSSLTAAGEDDEPEAAGGGQGNGKVSLQDFHFIVMHRTVEEDGDTLVFDITTEDPGQDPLAAAYMKYGDIKGDVAVMLEEALAIIAGADTLDECDRAARAALETQGATFHAIGTDYGLDLVIRLPDGVEPQPVPPCALEDKRDKWIELPSIGWGVGGDGAPQATLARIGANAIVVNGSGAGADGSFCVDLQPDDETVLCVPNSVPTEE